MAKAFGLYHPETEHDACGVGFVAHIKGLKSHDILEKALRVLSNLAHRGATGCDPETGDGAGVLIQIPHAFYKAELLKQSVNLPDPGMYAVGMLFFPPEPIERARYEAEFEKVVEQEGLTLLGWRSVPIDNSTIGPQARSVEPVIRQIFIGRSADIASDDAFERKLYLLRRTVQNSIVKLRGPQEGYFYVNSLSCRTVVYKGLLMAHQIAAFYTDLTNETVETAIALVHQRFSTNTFPTWDLAHPFRYLAHNGEINTLRGNRNWMLARQANLKSNLFGDDLPRLFPLVNKSGSDSATLDNAVELLIHGGRSMAHALMMLIPEAWDKDQQMEPMRKAFYEYHACLIEPWDGPAGIAFTDGVQVGGILDRNGLRPARYLVTDDDLVVLGSETGVLDIEPEKVRIKGRLQPGKMFLVDTALGRIISDDEIKKQICGSQPYEQWLRTHRIVLSHLREPSVSAVESAMLLHDASPLLARQQAFGYTLEDMRIVLQAMAIKGEQPLGSMGTDTPLAALSDQPQLLYNYFKQLFAQVTNPPIDPIREELVMSLSDYIGRDGNLLDETEFHCRQLKLESPILSNAELEKLRHIPSANFTAVTLPALFSVDHPNGLENGIRTLREAASRAFEAGHTFLIISDRGVDSKHAPIPSLLATSAVHHHLVREGTRTQVGLIVESGEAREVMHFALLIGYGASAINPYLAYESIVNLCRTGMMPVDLTIHEALEHYIKAVNKGLLKTFAKMGISTLQSYRGAQIFEAIGLDKEMVNEYFTGTPSRLGGIGLDVIQREALARHHHAYPPIHIPDSLDLETGGQYQWRRFGEYHQYNPETVSRLQQAVRSHDYATFKEFTQAANEAGEHLSTLRGLLKFKPASPIPIDQVEPASEIVKRFVTGAMSLGSISREAHETLAIAMNSMGAKSNTGEGGEDAVRYVPDANGDSRRSAIKQIASARFGVTAHYLVNADELQIKMAQGAKPGEGGELPGHKVDRYIAGIRHSTPGVTLISPPPHHDIYSIEDLAQLIFDLKNVNSQARISVKLVAEVGVGTVAAGVAKAHADHVLISGHDGGTGASPLSSIKHAGIPWEMGLAETQQVLVANGLRGRIRVQTDGQLKTGRDVVIAAMLGAEEFGFSSAPLVAMGCIMMRVCHLNTCPVGIATQDPLLRKQFAGTPENVVAFFFFLADEVREIMAELGFAKIDDMVGRIDMLDTDHAINFYKANGLDLSPILTGPDMPESTAIRCISTQDHGLETAIDHEIIKQSELSLAVINGAVGNTNTNTITTTSIRMPIRNSNRTVGAMLSGRIARSFGAEGLPEDTINIAFTGSAGQSFGAFLARGVTMKLEGDANDYLGKGLSGGKIIVYPSKDAGFIPAENIVAGNTLLYGATSGEVYLNGIVGERFAVRNSGARAVVEGTGDHGCEYMTGGVVVVLGATGRNFAAGMSGGVAYVWNPDRRFESRCNRNHGLTVLESVENDDAEQLRSLIEKHLEYTGSARAGAILADWSSSVKQFVKVVSLEYRRAQAEERGADSPIPAAALV
jgi:glutamate synthase domain-containing protein 2/glutamate synthase domain-containing protein 1/glutamate synthase domain-containing protein 3